MENLTRHALTRMQQRGIPPAALACLLDYGRRQHDHHGGTIVFLDKAARHAIMTLPRPNRAHRDNRPAPPFSPECS